MGWYDLEDDDLSLDLPIPPCCQCLRRTLLSILTLMVMTAAVIACSVSLSMATSKTKDLLGSGENYIHVGLTAIHGSCKWFPVIMIVLGSLLLVLASLSSFPHSYVGIRNICTRAVNVLVMFVLVLVQVVWIVITSGLMVPVAMFLLVQLLVEILDVTRMNMKDYYTLFLLTEEHYKLQGFKLDQLQEDSNSIFKCYTVAFVSSLVVCLCLTFFNMIAVANFKHLKKQQRKKATSEQHIPSIEESGKHIDDSVTSIPLMAYPAAPSAPPVSPRSSPRTPPRHQRRTLTPPHLLAPARHQSPQPPAPLPHESLDDVDAPSPLLNGSILQHSDSRLTPLSDRHTPLPDRLTPLSRTSRFRADSRFTISGSRDALSYLRSYFDSKSSRVIRDVFGHLAQVEMALDRAERR